MATKAVSLVHLLAGLALLLAAIDLVSAARKDVGIYVLRRGDFTLQFTNYGASMLSAVLPDKHGNLADVVLGFETLDGYTNDTTYFGALVGRVANRIGKAQFILNGVLYKLSANDGNNTLHGGTRGFGDVVWDVESYNTESHVTFTYRSFDGEEGFPGDLAISVTYLLIGKNKLGVDMEAKPLNKPTPVNLALHTYWNLRGHDSGDVLSHKIQLFASKITPVDSQLIPTGEIRDIRGTSYDFLQPRSIGSRIHRVPGGYDINYVLDETRRTHLKRVAVLHDGVSGRKMQLWSNQPGIQFYTSNMLNNTEGKGGFVYKKHGGVCLETQGFPDSVNHPNFPSQIVNPGQTYKHVMLFRFTA
ncbi:hypothetical protein SAY87_003902 [Trapa incisa]|uniref:Aldose 1-epimerase n=1 Tax=Trapa incisa TaxID=236973 RepID=A0AAN7JN44_9MYRT|nr:hypothetical protein SAY87_003902 [Trapa incisa]